jgi:hypothetical protein
MKAVAVVSMLIESARWSKGEQRKHSNDKTVFRLSFFETTFEEGRNDGSCNADDDRTLRSCDARGEGLPMRGREGPGRSVNRRGSKSAKVRWNSTKGAVAAQSRGTR